MNSLERENWLRERKNYTGGSDVAAIMSLNSYCTANEYIFRKDISTRWAKQQIAFIPFREKWIIISGKKEVIDNDIRNDKGEVVARYGEWALLSLELKTVLIEENLLSLVEYFLNT